MIHLLIQWISLTLVSPILGAGDLQSRSFIKDEEVDVRYKKQLPIYLQHDLGDVQIHGWNQDLIRVKIKKTSINPTDDDARTLFSSFQLISLETPKSIEIRMGTPPGTDLLTKLKNRNLKPKIKVDLDIRAPSTLPLSIVLGEGRTLKLFQWKGRFELTGKSNSLEWHQIKLANPLNVNCQDCSLLSEDSEFSGNLLFKNKGVQFKKTKASPGTLNLDLQNGPLIMDSTAGHFRIRSQQGEIASVHHQGSFEIQTQSGQVSIQEFQGDLDLQSFESEVKIHANRIDHHLEIKNRTGEITLSLPRRFSGKLDLQSIGSEVSSDFPVFKYPGHEEEYGPEIRGKIIGKVGEQTSPLIAVFSDSGNIRIHRREDEL